MEDIQAFAKKAIQLKKEIAQLEKDIERKKAQKRTIEEHDLPRLAIFRGLSKYETTDSIAIKHDLKHRGSIAQDRMHQCMKIIGKHKLASGFKEVITIKIPYEPDGKIEDKEVIEALNSVNADYEIKSEIHWKTLESLINNLVELIEKSGDEEEMEQAKALMKISEYYKTTIKEKTK